MHEFSLMGEVLEVVRDSAREQGIRRVHRIQMTVGALGCVFPPALEQAFGILRDGDALFADATLEIEERPVRVHCNACGWSAEGADARFLCVECGANAVEVMSGEELTIDGYEGE